MRRSVAIRLSLFIVATLVSLVYLAPTFVHDLPPWWSSFLPTDRIHLGLDLQGGSHLLLEVKVDKAIENNVERIKADLTNVLRDRGISGVSVERVQGTQIQLKVPAASVERVRGLLKSDFANLTVVNTQASGGTTEFFLTLSKEEIRSLRDYAVDQSLETIRNRIDQFGVSEPIIQREGTQDILIQLPGIQDPQRAKELIGRTAVLEFKLLAEVPNADDYLSGKTPLPTDLEILKGIEADRAGSRGRTQYLVQKKTLMTGDTISD